MAAFLGEIACKIDPKCRLAIPTRFLKQIPNETHQNWIVNRGFEKCLVLYTATDWQSETTQFAHLNLYEPEQRTFARLFFRGASELALDEQNRILLPKRLIDYADLDKDVVLVGYMNRIEIWNETIYDTLMNTDAENYTILAKKIMGTSPNFPEK